ncbi:MAG: hypothetical protein QF895_04970 [SAR86 cluster bacterium]|nr:hypothetical protein [SAR86 cluster bacterium]
MKKSCLLVLAVTFSFHLLSSEEDSEVHDLMAYVLDPAAEAIWDSAGFVITEEGETNLAPTNQEGWDKVKHGAKVISESSYLLSMPERAVDQAQWVALSMALKGMGEKAFKAAENEDSEALFEIGAELYQICVACHQIYWIKEN